MNFKKSAEVNGFTLVETLFLLGVVSVVAFAMLGYLNSQTKMRQKLENKEKVSVELNTLVDRALSVVSNIGHNSDEGICKFILPQSTSGGVGEVDFVIHPENSVLLNDEWTRAFAESGWIPDSTACSSGLYTRCFSLDSETAKTYESIKGMNPSLKVELIPVEMRSSGGKSFLPIKRNSQKTSVARDTGVIASVVVDLKKGETVERVNDFGLIWAGQVTCKKRMGNSDVMVSASAMGSGLSTNLFLSSSRTLPNPGSKFMNIEYRHEVRASTVMLDGLIQADRSYDKSFAFQCSEQTFRCASDATQGREWGADFFGRLWAKYNSRNSRIRASTIEAYNLLCFGKNEKDLSCATQYQFTSLGGVSRKLGEPIIYTEDRSQVDINVFGEAASICNMACKPGSTVNYNRLSAKKDDYESPQLYRAYLKTIYAADVNIEQTDADPKPLGCACCFKKQCVAYGLNSSGGCDEAPIEPLDARIPECQREKTAQAEDGIHQSVASAHRCVAADLVNDKLVLSAVSCSERMPASCFFQGKMSLSKDLNKNAANVTYASASESCYDMGRIVVDAVAFRSYLEQQPGAVINAADLPPVVDGKYDYIDNAYVGAFLAPYTSEMISQLVADMKEQKVQRAWVPMRTDGAGVPYYLPFFAHGEKSPYLNYNYTGVQRFERVGGHSFAQGAQDALILTNHRRWQGALPVSTNQTSAMINVVCLDKNGRAFKSSYGAKRLEEGPGACRLQDGIFAPVRDGAQVAALLNWLAPADAKLPWSMTEEVRGAWLAYVKNSSGEYVPYTTLDTSSGIVGVTGVALSSAPTDVTHVICKENAEFKLNPKAETCSTYAGTQLTSVEKSKIETLLFEKLGWRSSAIVSLNEVVVEKKE